MDRLLAHPATEDAIRRIITSSPHAIGVEGMDESGKKYVSKYIASKVLGVNDIEKHPYTIMLDCSDKIGIEEIRDSIKFLALKIPGDKRYKRCLMFWSFERLGQPAQNTLLKSLEEPPEDTLIIITIGSKRALLPTIVSRLSWIRVLPVSLSMAADFFSSEFDNQQIKKAYALSSGKPAMLSKLLADYEAHPLVSAIASAKEVLRMDKLNRMAEIERLNKDKELDIELYLKSLSKILEAALIGGIKKSGKPDRKILDNLKRIISAENSKAYNSNQKLILTDIFYNL